MGRECPSCGQDALPQARFCTACGRSFDAATGPLVPGLLPGTGHHPGTAPDPAGWPGGGIWAKAIAVLAVLALMSASAGIYVGLRSHWFSSGSSQAAGSSPVGFSRSAAAASDQSTRPGRSPGPAGPERSQLRQLAPLIRRSARARVAVAVAVQQAGRCRLTPGRAIGLLQHAISERQAAVARASRLRAGAIPDGSALVGYLVAALQRSSAADRAFIGWLQDSTGRHSCPLKAARNHWYQVGLRASGQATAAKAGFLRLWNPLARRFGQPAFTAGGI